MKIVQSFWSCQETNLLEFKAGWISPEYNIMSWALSSLQLKKYYSSVVLYADTASAKLLIDSIQLPYSEVICNLDDLSNYDPRLWALPKIMTYWQQEKPFLHIDGDVFIWKEFNEDLLSGSLIAQNLEVSTDYYENIMRSLELELNYFPSEILAERKSASRIYAYNAGILGGHDILFFKTYAKAALNFINRNLDSLARLDVSNFNIFFEQYLFYCLSKVKGKDVSVLVSEVIGDNKYKGFGDFVDVPHNKHYLHLLGDYKRIRSVCEQMANRLREDYPEYYYRIIALFKSNKAPVLKDYYWFESDVTEQGLLQRHHFLKKAYEANRINVSGEASERSWSKEPIKSRSSLLKAALDSLGAKVFPFEAHLRWEDLKKFDSAIAQIQINKFLQISPTYLLARDISSTGYPTYIFGDKSLIYDKVIVAESQVQKIESKFDWTVIDTSVNPILVNQMIEAQPSEIYTLVIPECDPSGYSLASIDELDLLILQTLEEPKTISELFDQIRHAFDSDDLESSKAEFEELIFGRVKKGLVAKSIKAVRNLAI